MSKTTTLLNTCPTCGAEESLDNIILRMIDDDATRRLIADVVTMSLPLGGLVVRYLRLFKPAHQKLRLTKAAMVLAELVPDIRRAAITRKNREWHAPAESWKLALQAVFEAAEKETLKPPLGTNAYLYEVLVRMADQVEGKAEQETEVNRRHGGPPPVVKDEVAALTATGLQIVEAPKGPSKASLRMQAEIKERLARQRGEITESQPEGSNHEQ